MGIAGRDDLKQDTTYHPIENAKALGKLLVKSKYNRFFSI
jgi:hypothetical protein